jgi:hypothetical protein
MWGNSYDITNLASNFLPEGHVTDILIKKLLGLVYSHKNNSYDWKSVKNKVLG